MGKQFYKSSSKLKPNDAGSVLWYFLRSGLPLKLCICILLFSLALSAFISYVTTFDRRGGDTYRQYAVLSRHVEINVNSADQSHASHVKNVGLGSPSDPLAQAPKPQARHPNDHDPITQILPHKQETNDNSMDKNKQNAGELTKTTIQTTTIAATTSDVDIEIQYDVADVADQQELACKFAMPDPWDPSIMPYVEHRNGFECGYVQPYLSFVDEGTFLVLNETEYGIQTAQIKHNESLVCSYAPIDRLTPRDDFNISFGRFTEITPGQRVAVPTNAVNVVCEVMPGKQVLYNNSHAIFSRAQVRQQNPGDESEERLSAMLLMLDSTSLGMFRRQLPKTYRYIKHKMKFNFIKGYHKVGYNSFPNMVPILTGKRVWYQQPGMPDEFEGENVLNTSVDHWPFVWKNFSEKGYITMYNEDTPYWGLFQVYDQKGFYVKPVDHYFRPYWISQWRSQLNSRSYCYGNFPKPKLQLDIVRDMYKHHKNKLKFIYTFLCEISHNYAYDLERMDDVFLEFFTNMHESNALNKTILLLASDHGLVFGDMRKTLVGALEERLPIFGVWLPNWFYQKHPNIHHNLLINQLRLSGNFDIRATLFDVLNSNFNGQQQPANQRSMSHLYEISANRSCTDAGIPQQYCTCTAWTPVPTNGEAPSLVSEFLVGQINNYLKSRATAAKSCAVFQLARILRAEFSKPETPVLDYEDSSRSAHYKDSEINEYPRDIYELMRERKMSILRVAVEVSPGAAQFEGQVSYHNATYGNMTLYGETKDISRLNAYGSQSACVSDPVLRKLCFCI